MNAFIQVVPTQITGIVFFSCALFTRTTWQVRSSPTCGKVFIPRMAILRLVGADRLNPNNDPPGISSFVILKSITVDSEKRKELFFPVLEPPDRALITHFSSRHGGPILYEVVDSTQAMPLQIARTNIFCRGKYQGGQKLNEIAPAGN